jgi:hypothetical protein
MTAIRNPDGEILNGAEIRPGNYLHATIRDDNGKISTIVFEVTSVSKYSDTYSIGADQIKENPNGLRWSLNGNQYAPGITLPT